MRFRPSRAFLLWSATLATLVGGTAYTLTLGNDGSMGSINAANASEAAADAAREAHGTAETRKPAGVDSAEDSTFKDASAPTEHGEHGDAAVVAAAATRTAGGSCIVDQAAVEDLQRQRAALEARQKDLAAREADLKALEKNVNDELKQLEQVRLDMQKVEAMKKSENEEKVARIVETLQTMSPKAAAQLLTTLEDALAVTAISRMDTARLAKVMNVMETGRASRLTELLAGVVRANKPVTVSQADKPARSTASRTSASMGADRTADSTKGGDRK